MSTNREIRRAISDYQTSRGFSFVFFIYASAFAVLPTFPFTFLTSSHLLLMVIWLICTGAILGAMGAFPKFAIAVAVAATCLIGYYFTWDFYLEKGFAEASVRFLVICLVSFTVHRLALIDLESNS